LSKYAKAAHNSVTGWITVVERASEEPIRDAGDEGTDLALWQAQAPLRFEVAVKPSEQIESRPV
jgi:hypothetical protein